MSKKIVEEFLIKGGNDKSFKAKYDDLESKDIFVKLANEDGFDFTVEELDAVLNESGDSFESFGNPRKKGIWWR